MKLEYQQQLQKAREEYKKTGKMDQKRACILLNCQTAVGLWHSDNIKKRLYEFNLNTLDLINVERIIKKIEKKFGVGQYLNPKNVCAIALYVSLCINGKYMKKADICSIFGINMHFFKINFDKWKTIPEVNIILKRCIKCQSPLSTQNKWNLCSYCKRLKNG